MSELLENYYSICDAEDYKVALSVAYEEGETPLDYTNWSLYINTTLVLKYTTKNIILSAWIEALKDILEINKTNRVLIIGGGNQFLSNFILKYPSNITILDPYCFHYFNTKIVNSILNIKPYLNIKDSIDGKIRKLCLIDSTLEEAVEDECFSKEEFDLIIIDNYIDTIEHKTGIYTKELIDLCFDLLRHKGFLAINQKYATKKINNKVLIDYPTSIIDSYKQNNKYYLKYTTYINEIFCETDFVPKANQRISVFSKIY